jgi:predicted RNA-binding protein with TRAM domain
MMAFKNSKAVFSWIIPFHKFSSLVSSLQSTQRLKNIRLLSVPTTVPESAVANSNAEETVRKTPLKFNPFPFHYHELVDITIESIDNMGFGTAWFSRADSTIPLEKWVIRVPHVIEGEKVRVKIYSNFKKHSEADLVEVLEPSPRRIIPKCKYFQQCGGCQYQHISIEDQRTLKRKHVIQTLEKIGKLSDAAERVNPVKRNQRHLPLPN